VYYAAAEGKPMTIEGQGPLPAAATVEKFEELGVKKMPGSGRRGWCCHSRVSSTIIHRDPFIRFIKRSRLRNNGNAAPCLGLLAAVVPGAFDAWLLLLATHGTMRPRQVLESFIGYCIDGVPVEPSLHNGLGRRAAFFAEKWPSSAEAYLDADNMPPAKDGRCVEWLRVTSVNSGQE
jgi:hypothetical protein